MLQQTKKAAVTVTALAALGLGGSAIADAASSQSTATPTGAASSQSTAKPAGATTQPSRASYPAHDTAAHESLEKPVSGTAATKARAAAVKSAGGGAAGAVTTDVSGNGYEVTVTKSDGSKVEVHLDGSFAVDHGQRG